MSTQTHKCSGCGQKGFSAAEVRRKCTCRRASSDPAYVGVDSSSFNPAIVIEVDIASSYSSSSGGGESGGGGASSDWGGGGDSGGGGGGD